MPSCSVSDLSIAFSFVPEMSFLLCHQMPFGWTLWISKWPSLLRPLLLTWPERLSHCTLYCMSNVSKYSAVWNTCVQQNRRESLFNTTWCVPRLSYKWLSSENMIDIKHIFLNLRRLWDISNKGWALIYCIGHSWCLTVNFSTKWNIKTLSFGMFMSYFSYAILNAFTASRAQGSHGSLDRPWWPDQQRFWRLSQANV